MRLVLGDQAQRDAHWMKSKARSTKSETNSKHQIQNAAKTRSAAIRICIIGACFGFRTSNFVLRHANDGEASMAVYALFCIGSWIGKSALRPSTIPSSMMYFVPFG